MPGRNGYEATEVVREFIEEVHATHPYIVALTGNVEEQQIDMAFTSGFDELIAKPANIDKIKIIL